MPGKTNTPLLSIVTICYNNRNEIAATLESVLSQKTAEVEYVIVDGGSRDGTLEVIRAHENTIDRVISEADSGIYDAINKGIKASNGDWIGLVHAGDRLVDGCLRHILPKLRERSYGIVYGPIKLVRGDSLVSMMGTSADLLETQMLAHPGAFVSRKVYENVGLYDTSYRVAADYKAFLDYKRAGVPFYWMDVVVSEFEVGGISSRTELADKEVQRIHSHFGIAQPVSRGRRTLRALRDLVQAFGRVIREALL